MTHPATPSSPTADGAVLLHARDDRGVHTLTLNTPRSFNVLSEAMLAALQAAIDAVAADPQARLVVIGANGKAFCAGHDLKEMKANPAQAYYQALFALGCILFLITMVISISIEFIGKKKYQ